MPERSRQPIGIFDSGEGGLTVARAVAELLPGEELVYACDTANFPYGPRSLTEVRGFFLQFVEFFAAQNCKLVVVACNTATAAALDLLAGGLRIPALGVVQPGARAAARITRNGRVGVAATQATCNAGIYPQFLLKERPDLAVVQEPCPILVIRAEAGVISGPKVRTEVERCLRPLLAAGIDTLVLGCTHFPHMRAVIVDVVGPRVQLVDPGVETAVAVAEALQAAGSVSDLPVGPRSYFTTGDPQRFVAIASRLWPEGGIREAAQIKISADTTTKQE